MRNGILKHPFLFLCTLGTLFFSCLSCINADTYKDGLITVQHEEIDVIREGQHIQFNHPCKLSEQTIAGILSSVFYKEKGFLRRVGTLRVFHDDEIKALAPLIVRVLSVATPTQVISFSSYYYRLILSDRHNCGLLFIKENSLNIAFSHVHQFQTMNDFMSDKKGYFATRENPIHKRRSSFWKLTPSPGQHLEPGHENWLVVDLHGETETK
ncbi:MAG: hypothetical protein U0586_04745 [Candidatus Brocadiaceae bacterium]